MAPVPGDPGSEIERLRAENRALDEQIKLLVQTEQRFYRSQDLLDTQLARLQRLATFALETTALQGPAEILRRAIDALEDSFDFDWVGAFAIDAPAGGLALVATSAPHGGPRRVALAAADLDALRRLAGPVFHVASPGHQEEAPMVVQAVAAALPGGPTRVAGFSIVVPLRTVGRARPGAIVAFTGDARPRVARPDGTSERQRPFLQLLANHVEHAIAGTELTENLRENASRLAHSLESLERAQQQLLQAQKMDAIGRLAGGVAHDFNNLLTVILGYAGALSSSLPPDAPQQENVQRVLEAARRAADITSQLLALGRRQLRRLEDLDLSHLASRTAELLSRLLGEDIAVELDLDRSLPPVRADRAQVEQVLLNLVVNARDAMPSGGRLRVATRLGTAADAERCAHALDPGRYAVLEVRDDGVGMDEATKARAFEPFFSTKEGSKGGGLGLAVVYGIVTQTEGHVFVESAPGRGSCFSVLWPLSPDGAVATERAAGAETVRVARADASGRVSTVLVVEDEAALAEVVRATLARAGHTVFVAGDGEDALAQLQHMSPLPDLVLTDVLMPRLGGLPMASASPSAIRRCGSPSCRAIPRTCSQTCHGTRGGCCRSRSRRRSWRGSSPTSCARPAEAHRAAQAARVTPISALNRTSTRHALPTSTVPSAVSSGKNSSGSFRKSERRLNSFGISNAMTPSNAWPPVRRTRTCSSRVCW